MVLHSGRALEFPYNGSDLSSVERYDPVTNAWKAVAPMMAARSAVGVAVLDGKLYAVGGYNDNDGRLSSVERYDPALDAWEAVAPLAAARANLAAAVLNGKLYVMGGNDENEALSSLERYDPATNAWEAAAPLTTARSFQGITVARWRLGVGRGRRVLWRVEGGEESKDSIDPACAMTTPNSLPLPLT